jgi:hypothetical protein
MWVTVMVAVLAAPTTAAVASPPAVDQYTQHLPTAGGGGQTGGTPPIARPGLLPSKTRAALSGPDGPVLAQITTARGLGAPAPTGSASKGGSGGPHNGTGTSHKSRSFATVVADTAGTGPSLILIGALAGIAIGGVWARSSQRRRSSGPPTG